MTNKEMILDCLIQDDEAFTQIGVNDLIGGVLSSSADVGRNHMLGLIHNTHIWESPNVERWYPFK